MENRRPIKNQKNKKYKKEKEIDLLSKIILVVTLMSIVIIFLYSPILVNIMKLLLLVVAVICIFLATKTKHNNLLKIINILIMLIMIFFASISLQSNITLKEMTKITEDSVNPKAVNMNKEPFNILISGTDTRDDQIDEPSRSDTIMVATVNPKTQEILLTSLPRDTYYQLTCSGEYDKLTHASEFGMDCLVSTVESILNTEINYYVKANFSAVINAINAVGGIDVEVDSAFCGQDEEDYLNAYCFEPGMTHMSGEEALSYARERHAFSDGDYTRAYHQQQVLEAFLKALMFNPTAIDDLFAIVGQSVRTNMSVDEMKDMFSLLITSDNITSSSLVISGSGTTVNIPYQGLYGKSVQVLDPTSLANTQSEINRILTDN